MRDKIIERVINKIKSRSDVGYKKYGVTLKDDHQSLDVWLTHIQEELMDAVNKIHFKLTGKQHWSWTYGKDE